MLEQMDLRWLHVFAAHVLLLMSFSKNSIINFRGAEARNFQQLNMGFGKGSAAKQGRVAWSAWATQTRGMGRKGDRAREGPLPWVLSSPQAGGIREGL